MKTGNLDTDEHKKERPYCVLTFVLAAVFVAGGFIFAQPFPSYADTSIVVSGGGGGGGGGPASSTTPGGGGGGGAGGYIGSAIDDNFSSGIGGANVGYGGLGGGIISSRAGYNGTYDLSGAGGTGSVFPGGSAGDGGSGSIGNATSGGSGGAGGAASLTISGDAAYDVVSVRGGNPGQSGAGGGGSGGNGGDASLSVAGALSAGSSLSVQSGEPFGGSASFSATALTTPSITLTDSGAGLGFNVGTLDVTTGNTTLNMDGTTAGAGGVTIGTALLDGGNTFTVNNTNSGAGAFGALNVTGTGGSLAGTYSPDFDTVNMAGGSALNATIPLSFSTLNIEGAGVQFTGNLAASGEAMNFYLPDNTAAGSIGAMLTGTNAIDITGANINLIVGSGSMLNKNDEITLIDASASSLSGTPSVTSATAGYDFEIVDRGADKLVVKVVNAPAPPPAPSSQSNAATAAASNSGSPPTGDNGSPSLWMWLCGAALIVLVGLAVRTVKRRGEG